VSPRHTPSGVNEPFSMMAHVAALSLLGPPGWGGCSQSGLCNLVTSQKAVYRVRQIGLQLRKIGWKLPIVGLRILVYRLVHSACEFPFGCGSQSAHGLTAGSFAVESWKAASSSQSFSLSNCSSGVFFPGHSSRRRLRVFTRSVQTWASSPLFACPPHLLM